MAFARASSCGALAATQPEGGREEEALRAEESPSPLALGLGGLGGGWAACLGRVDCGGLFFLSFWLLWVFFGGV